MVETLATLVGIGFVGQMSPGPDMMMLVRHSMGRTRVPALACVLGVSTGFCVHVCLSVFGLAVLLRQNVELFNAVRYAGACYLLWIGAQCLRSRSGLNFSDGAACAAGGWFEGFRNGLFCNLLNPKVTLFVLSVFTQLVRPETPLPEKLVYASALVVETVAVWMAFVLLLYTPALRHVLERRQNVLNACAGLVFCVLGGAIFVM
ncbi:RhtB (resistance to homoserine/threonine) family protein [Desulfobaculum xiamenense]|uniref:RhtB (Resistance to homoserine/threonine) family protein n=1 Tax=Desulfobaculum xiamenense TaxID=995050 RepID=A0A846QJY0_9BACT|nr:LysE family translocator [Desulfobaculum xiamenense]NJB66483.1 RhtB (resistance to homoserine/threonine) family protein [Desulfobaculum xiamenense]